MATAHLIHGYLGVGKTTYARKLAAELGAVYLSIGVDVVLDFGYWRRQDRDRARHLAAVANSAVTLHWVVADDAVARDRCLRRNDDPQASFVIDASAYDSLRQRYEEPTRDEAPVVVRSE